MYCNVLFDWETLGAYNKALRLADMYCLPIDGVEPSYVTMEGEFLYYFCWTSHVDDKGVLTFKLFCSAWKPASCVKKRDSLHLSGRIFVLRVGADWFFFCRRNVIFAKNKAALESAAEAKGKRRRS